MNIKYSLLNIMSDICNTLYVVSGNLGNPYVMLNLPTINFDKKDIGFRNYFKSYKSDMRAMLLYNPFENIKNEIKTFDQIESITFIFKFSESNELKIKKNIKDQVTNVIKKRTNEINELKKERNELQEKIDRGYPSLSLEEIKEFKQEIDLIGDQIYNHNKEITKAILNVNTDIVVGDEECEYRIILFRNIMIPVAGLPNQSNPFSLIWLDQDKCKIMEPTSSIITNQKNIKISYNDL